MSNLRVSEFRDPAAIIEEFAAKVPLVEGKVVLAAVRNPSTEQHLIHIETLPVDSRIEHHRDVQNLLYERILAMPVPESFDRLVWHAVVTIVVRPGFALFGPIENEWTLAWRYTNHNRGAFTGDIMTVTEHGWSDLMSHTGGHVPRMMPRPSESGVRLGDGTRHT